MRKHWNSIPGKVLPHVNFFGELYRILCGLLQVNLYTALTSMVNLICICWRKVQIRQNALWFLTACSLSVARSALDLNGRNHILYANRSFCHIKLENYGRFVLNARLAPPCFPCHVRPFTPCACIFWMTTWAIFPRRLRSTWFNLPPTAWASIYWQYGIST